MKVREIKTVFNDYRKTGLLVAFPRCTFKCCHEQGLPTSVCQNHGLCAEKLVDISPDAIVERYDANIHHALICGGLEPIDDIGDLLTLIHTFRKKYKDDIVIFTGYNLDEIPNGILAVLRSYGDVYLKFGRYVAGDEPKYDEVLGITLISSNQYGVKL